MTSPTETGLAGRRDGGVPRTRPLATDAVLGAARALRSTTVEVAPELLPDLVAVAGATDRRLWQHDGDALLGIGEALRIPLDGGLATRQGLLLVDRSLSEISCDDPLCLPGTGPVAMGALPYDPAEPGHLCVPRLLVGRRTGRAWATLTEPARASTHGGRQARAVQRSLAALHQTTAGNEEPPDAFSLSATLPHKRWREIVANAVEEANAGRLTKVVVARRVDVTANRAFSLGQALRRLAALYPSCAVFHIEGFIGASPETLVQRRGLDIFSFPLAGTVARSGDQATDDALVEALLASAKERLEHKVVVDAIASTLRPWCASLEVPAQPSVVPLRNVCHLGTLLHGVLPPTGALTSLEVAAALQPTPAVGGIPQATALAWQRANEGFSRGLYAGPVGWTDSRGDGAWAVGVRSADISGRRASLYAGAGVVAGSDPEAELAETQLKLQALLAALVRP
ncbi:MAG: isochorismate synthase [Acidimicrobiales bacterium]